MKTLRILPAFILLLVVIGCTNLTPTQRLTLAENAYNTATESVTKLHKVGVIPKEDDAAIIAANHAARAALDAANSHRTDSTFETAIAAAEAAVNSFTASYKQAEAASPPKPTTKP